MKLPVVVVDVLATMLLQLRGRPWKPVPPIQHRNLTWSAGLSAEYRSVTVLAVENVCGWLSSRVVGRAVSGAALGCAGADHEVAGEEDAAEGEAGADDELVGSASGDVCGVDGDVVGSTGEAGSLLEGWRDAVPEPADGLGDEGSADAASGARDAALRTSPSMTSSRTR